MEKVMNTKFRVFIKASTCIPAPMYSVSTVQLISSSYKIENLTLKTTFQLCQWTPLYFKNSENLVCNNHNDDINSNCCYHTGDSLEIESCLDEYSRWSVTSLRGPGERNFNVVSHKPKLTGTDWIELNWCARWFMGYSIKISSPRSPQWRHRSPGL